MGKPKNASGKSKGDTITMRVTGELKRRITKVWKLSQCRNSPFQDFLLVLIEKGITEQIIENQKNFDKITNAIGLPPTAPAGPREASG